MTKKNDKKDALRPYGKDHFWNYLWYCDRYGPVSPGDYLEEIDMITARSFLKLVTDLSDTRKVGRLRAIPLENGGMGYVPVTPIHWNGK